MSTTVTVYPGKFAIVDENDHTYNNHTAQSFTNSGRTLKYMLLGDFISSINAYKFKAIEGATLHVYTSGNVSRWVEAEPLFQDFDPNTVKGEVTSFSSYRFEHNGSGGTGYVKLIAENEYSEQSAAAQIIKAGVKVGPGGIETIYTPASSHKPYLKITFSDNDVTLNVTTSGGTGYTPKNAPVKATWRLWNSSPSAATTEQAGATINITQNGQLKRIDISDAKTSYEIPGSYVTDDVFTYSVTVRTADGREATSPPVSRSTVEVLSTCSIRYPSATIEDGSEPIELAWSHIISTGTAQTSADIEYSVNGGISYSTLARIEGSTEKYTVPAKTFPAGEIYWRVRTYNSDGNPGSWATAIINVADAPDTPDVNATEEPRTVINWTAGGQQSYQIRIDDSERAVVFGTANTERLNEYLPDGNHTIAVRVQNSFGLWSDWGTDTINVQNIPGETIILEGSTDGKQTVLSWNDAEYDGFIIEKNGRYIAKTNGNSYVDLYSGANCVYKILGIYNSNGNYGASNEVSINCIPETLVIRKVTGGEWMLLSLYTSSVRDSTTGFERTGTYRHFFGAEEPVLELSSARDRTLSFEAAFKDSAEAKAFEKLIGEQVIVKDTNGSVFYGVILSSSRITNNMYTIFACSIRNVYRSEDISI